MATQTPTTPPGVNASGLPALPCRVGPEDEFLALVSLRDRTTARIYELLDLLDPPGRKRPAFGARHTSANILVFTGGAA